MSIEPMFIGVLKDRSVITKDSLKNIASIPYIDYIFMVEFKTLAPNVTQRFGALATFIPINADGSKRVIKINDYEIIDISSDKELYGRQNWQARTICLSEKSGEKTIKFISDTRSENFIEYDLMPLIDTLEKTNSWDIFLKLQELKKANTEIEMLKNKIAKLEEKLKEVGNVS